MKEYMAQADSPRQTCTFEEMNGQQQLFFSNKMIYYFKKWTTILHLQKFDASSRSYLTIPVSKNCKTPKENQA